MEQHPAYLSVRRVMNTITNLGSAAAVLGWDQETYMPNGAVEARAEQMATLSTLIHQFSTDEQAQTIAAEAEAVLGELTVDQQHIVDTFLRDHHRALRLPSDLVEEQARTAALAQDAWKRARAASDFSIFEPLLRKTFDLKRREAEMLGGGEHSYDLLLNVFEPGLTVASVTPIFDRLVTGTRALMSEITPRQGSVSTDVLHRSYPEQEQLAVATRIIQKLGFDMNTGRVDLTAHPFCTSFGSTDVRLTTRIRENDLRSCLFGLIHEAGHGMYEQGISPALTGTFSAQGASMGIHESQSLFWENIVARSPEFWQWAFPIVKEAFPDQLSDQSPDTFYRAINAMKPSLNRVECDELTYNLHIILRFEIERDIIAGIMDVSDIPARWNDMMSTMLGVTPNNDSEGCLQDVHWSFGGIGYFPSYTLGKLYAAMEWNAMKVSLPNVSDNIANGEFAPILGWLRTHIHSYGRTEMPHEIIQRISGRPLTEVDFLNYVGAKARNVYEF